MKKYEIKEIRILISQPDPYMTTKITKLVATSISTIASSLERLNELKQDNDLSEKERKKLHVMVFEDLPIQSMFIRDPEVKTNAGNIEEKRQKNI